MQSRHRRSPRTAAALPRRHATSHLLTLTRAHCGPAQANCRCRQPFVKRIGASSALSCPRTHRAKQPSRSPHVTASFIGVFCLLRCVRRKPSPPTPPQPGSVTASVGRQRDRAQARAASRHHCRYSDANCPPCLRANAQHTARTPMSRSEHRHARFRKFGPQTKQVGPFAALTKPCNDPVGKFFLLSGIATEKTRSVG